MLWFLWANVALLGCAAQGVPLLRPAGGPWMRAMSTLFGAVALLLLITLGAGITGMLRPEVFALVPTVLWGVVAVVARRFQMPNEPWALPPTTPWSALGTVLLLTATGLWIAGPGWSGTRFIYDDITYHAAVPAIWTQWQTIDYTNLSYQAYYPFDAELLGLWFVVPLRHFGHAGLGVLITVGLLITSFGALGERFQTPTAPLLTLLAALFVSPKMLYFARTYSANDLAMAAFLLVMLVYTLAPPTLRTAIWSGLAAGAAVGTKVSAAPIVALVAWVWIVRSRRDPRWIVAFLGATVPLGAYWYIHNWVQTGNPLFPAEIGPFEGPLDKKSQARTTIAWFLVNRSNTLEFWKTLLYSRLNWPLVLGVGALLGYLRSAVELRRRPGLWLLFAAGLLFLMLHPMQPFSGTINRPRSPLHEMHRYIAFPIMVGLFLLATSVRHTRLLTLFAAGSWAISLASSWSKLPQISMRFATAFGFMGLLLVAFRSKPLRGGIWMAGLALLVLSWRTEPKRAQTVHNTLTFTKHGRYHTRAWRAIDRLPNGSSIAWISDLPPSHSFNLPNLGSRLQFQLVPLDIDARRHDVPLHKRWRSSRTTWWSDFRRRTRPQVPVLRNLLDSGADYLVLSRCQQSKKGGWPSPRGALLRLGGEFRVYNDRCTEVWTLDPLRGRTLLEPIRKPRKKREKK